MLKSAKEHGNFGYRYRYIPGWDLFCQWQVSQLVFDIDIPMCV